MKIKAASKYSFFNTTIDAYQDKFPYFASYIINDETGESIKLRYPIKMIKHRYVLIHAFSGDLANFLKGIRDIPGTETIIFI